MKIKILIIALLSFNMYADNSQQEDNRPKELSRQALLHSQLIQEIKGKVKSEEPLPVELEQATTKTHGVLTPTKSHLYMWYDEKPTTKDYNELIDRMLE